MKKLSYFRLLLLPATCLALISTVGGNPPEWWSEWHLSDPNLPAADVPPVLDANVVNNFGPANIGQAKHVARSALLELKKVAPSVANQIEVDLVGAGKPIPNWNAPVDQTEVEANHAALLLGQLKAIAHPFYNHLNAASPDWVLAQIQANHNGAAVLGTDYWKVSGNSDFAEDGYFPWNPDTPAEANRSIATIGQLKAVFSLAFNGLGTALPTDTDNDGLPDEWEIEHFGSLSSDGSANPDVDSLTNFEEEKLGTDPKDSDSDDDLAIDGKDAAPLDPLIDWEFNGSHRYVAVEMPREILTQSTSIRYSVLEVTSDADVVMHVTDSTTGAASDGYWRVGEKRFEVAGGLSREYLDPFWGEITRESFGSVCGLVGTDDSESLLYYSNAPVDWNLGGALFTDPIFGTTEFWEEFQNFGGEAYAISPIGGTWDGSVFGFIEDDGGISGGLPHSAYELATSEDEIRFVHQVHSVQQGAAIENHRLISATKGGWLAFYDKVLRPTDEIEIDAPETQEDDWLQDLPAGGGRQFGKIMISNETAASGVLLLDKDDHWESPISFEHRTVVGGTSQGGFFSSGYEMWTEDRPAEGSQNHDEDWIALRNWAGDELADLVDDGWSLRFVPRAINKEGVMAIEVEKDGQDKKVFVLLPIEVEELSPKLADEDDVEIPGSDRPAPAPGSTTMVERNPLPGTPILDASIVRTAWRDMKVRIGKHLAGKRVSWSMTAQFTPLQADGTPAAGPCFRGKWGTAGNDAHKHRFSASEQYGTHDYEPWQQMLEDETNAVVTVTARTTVGADGYTAIRVNLPPIGFNKARIAIEIEITPTHKVKVDLLDLEVPAVIVIDPGHGGILPPDPLAAGYIWSVKGNEWRLGGSAPNHAEGNPSKTKEKDMALNFSRLLRDRLTKLRIDQTLKLKIKMTRDADINLTLAARANFARDYGADQLLSIHFNGSNKSARGTEVQLDSTENLNEPADKVLAKRVADAAYGALHKFDTGASNRGVKIDQGLDVLSDPSLGNSLTCQTCRAGLLEVEFIDVPAVDLLLNTGSNHQGVRQAVMNAVADALLQDIRIQPES